MAPVWFNDDRDKTAKCVMFPAKDGKDFWFGDEEDEEEFDSMDEAKKICLGTDDSRPCPLLTSCREFAMANNERWGIWGGMTPSERAKLRKERRLASRQD